MEETTGPHQDIIIQMNPSRVEINNVKDVADVAEGDEERRDVNVYVNVKILKLLHLYE